MILTGKSMRNPSEKKVETEPEIKKIDESK